jgi:hypothetical protein
MASEHVRCLVPKERSPECETKVFKGKQSSTLTSIQNT